MKEMPDKKILGAIELVRDVGSRFSREFPPDDSAQVTFEHWSAGDVLHHLTAWLSYSCDRLSAILDGAPVREIDDLVAFNRVAWERGRSFPRGEISQRFAGELDRYRETVTRFTAGDFDRDDLPTGFDWSLWKYILLDTAVHPGWHFVYHGITRGHYDFAATVLDALSPVMLVFSGGDESVFDLSELADDPEGLANACASFADAFPDNPQARCLAARNRMPGR